jgi:5' nucleotidase family
LILRELEEEIVALQQGCELRRKLKSLLQKKELIGDLFNQLRLGHTRHALGRDVGFEHFETAESVKDALAQLLTVMDRLDQAITPLVLQDGSCFNERWGYLSIAGILL